MHHPDCGDPAATGQSGRRRVVLEHALEHGFRPARDSESAGEDHDWRGGGVYDNRVDAWFADLQRFAIGVAVGAGCARSEPESEPGAGATVSTGTTVTGDVTSRTGCVTCGDEVVALLVF